MVDLIPPQNIEAEIRVLGAVLLDESVLSDVRACVRPTDFYRTSNRLIFQAMCAIADQGEVIDILTLVDYLKKAGSLDAVGGPEYVATLSDDVSSAKRAPTFAKLVRNMAVLRNIIHTSGAVSERAFAEGEDPDVLLADSIRAFDEIVLGAGSSDPEIAAPLVEIVRDLGPDPDPIVEGLLMPGAAGIIAGSPSAGKTTTVDSMALSIAAGCPVFGKYPVPNPLNVLVIQLEDDERLHGRRSERLARGLGIDEIPPNIYRWKPWEFFLDDGRHMSMVRRFIEKTKIGFCVIDPFVYTHHEDENNNQAMARILRPAKKLAWDTGCTMAILHHYNKEDFNKPSGGGGRVRGAVAIRAWRQWLFYFHERGGARMIETENKWENLHGQRFMLSLSKPDDDTIQLVWGEANEKKSQDTRDKLMDAYLVASEGRPVWVSASHLGKQTGMSESNAKRRINELNGVAGAEVKKIRPEVPADARQEQKCLRVTDDACTEQLDMGGLAEDAEGF